MGGVYLHTYVCNARTDHKVCPIRCNTVSRDHPRERRVEIHARWDIAAGEEITTSYLRPTKDTQTRRQLLAHSWHFWCTCPRCGDREEGGARLASIVCPSE